MNLGGLPSLWSYTTQHTHTYKRNTSRVFFFFFNIYLFIYLWLCWVLASVRGPSPVAASGGHPPSRRAGPSPSRPLLLRSTGSRRAGSAIVAHGPSRSAARGIPPDQGPNPCPPHRQADPQPLRHQGSPITRVLNRHGQVSDYLIIPFIHSFIFEVYPCGHIKTHCRGRCCIDSFHVLTHLPQQALPRFLPVCPIVNMKFV